MPDGTTGMVRQGSGRVQELTDTMAVVRAARHHRLPEGPPINPLLVIIAATTIASGTVLPPTVPVPTARPDRGEETGDAVAPDPARTTEKDKVSPDTPEKQVPQIEAEDNASYQACLGQLKSLDVTARALPRIDDGNGCGIDKPVEISRIGTVEIKPKAVMRCATALGLAKWTTTMVEPMLKAADPPESLAGIDQASAYVCRNRNGAVDGKISEHARGNAIDIAGLRLTSGKVLPIMPRDQDSTMEGALQRAITAAACLYFTTVLDPGSDKAHETHLHLDVIARKSGYRLCW